MSMDKDITSDMRPEYRRDELGSGIRGKYSSRYAKGANLVLLEEQVAKAFPTSEAVNEALLGLITLARKTARPQANERSKKHD